MLPTPDSLLRLSHFIHTKTPIYPAAPPVEIAAHRLVCEGGKYNSYAVRMFNHCGTHVDAPQHVYDEGPALCEFALEDFMFARPCLVPIPMEDTGLIGREHLTAVLAAGGEWDLVIIRTGFGVHREDDPDRYATRNPGLSADGAHWLVENLPRLRAVGVDTISVTAGGSLEEGWRAHRILLNPENRRRLVIEDMWLPDDLPPLRRVWAIPLIVEGVDSSWCTVIGEAGVAPSPA